MKKNFTLFLAIFTILILAFFGCKNNSTNPILESIESAEDNSVVEGEYSSIFEFVDDEGENSSLFAIGKSNGKDNVQKVELALLPDCATKTIDTTTRTITIDFGTTNCLCLDGMYRRGKIHAQFIGPYRQIGSKVIVTLENYYVNDNMVTGIKTIERVQQYKWSIKVDSASVTTQNGTISWESDRTVERIAGNSTPLNIWDDEYLYTGTAKGVNRKGVAFEVNIDANFPLKKKIQIGCASTFISGKLTIENDKSDTLKVNYDPDNNEACDKKVEVDINGVKKIIYVR
ncbi:MAG: hypothetical protein M1419_05050 [Bacteroidetes bacterium]|nr:hypothetical protein [Bacteroidota bacterium]